jgi:cell division protein FtsB
MKKFNTATFATSRLRLDSVKNGAKWLGGKVFAAVMLIATLIFVIIFVLQSIQIRNMQGQYEQKRAEHALLEERNLRLKEHLEFLNSPGYMLFVEKVAREKLNLAKPDETVILPVFSETKPATAPEQTQAKPAPPAPQSRPAWQAWLSFFFGT